METIAISKGMFDKVLGDVGTLIEDVGSLFDQDELAKKRLEDIKQNPSIGKSEEELDEYLEKRGVKIEWLGVKRTPRFL